ncbi:MAG: hypothetical protein KC776_02405 [Myxococcales bacterium]|nr:hypothetical protein [Myxococcales bacterium]
MGRDTDGAVALVIMEAGAPWPSHANELSSQVSRTLVESQPPGELPDEFAARIAARVRRLEAKGARITRAIIATSEDTSWVVTEARSSYARLVLTAMAVNPAAELVLTADESVDEDVRHELFALAGALCEELTTSQVAVRVRFSPSPSQSGLVTLPSASRDSWVAESG